MFEVERSPEVLDLLYLDKGIHEIHQFLLVLGNIQHLVLHEAADEGSDHSRQLPPVLVVLGDRHRFFHVLERVRLEVLVGDACDLGEAGDDVDGVEADGAEEDALEVLCDERVVGHLDQEADSDEGVVLDQQVQVFAADVEGKHGVGLDLEAAVDLGGLILGEVVVEPFVDDLPALLKLLLDLGSVVPVHVGHDPRRQPVELRGRDIEEGGDGPHEADVETVVGHLLLLDGGAVDLGLRREVLLISFIEIGNHSVHLAALVLRNLHNPGLTLGRLAMNSSLIFFISGRSSTMSMSPCASSLSSSILILEYCMVSGLPCRAWNRRPVLRSCAVRRARRSSARC